MTGIQVYDIAQKIGREFFNSNMMEIIGAIVVEDDIYIRGFDGGFPHAGCTAKFNIETGELLES